MKKIDPAAIRSAASNVSSINRQLSDTLSSSIATVTSLRSVWSGQACEATISAFTTFANKYTAVYSDMLNQYSSFLNNQAAEGYETTEQQGVRLADTM